MEDINMKNEMKNEQAVSPVIATILMVAITVVLAGVLYVWANSLASDQPDAGTLNNFKAEDASDAISDQTDDTLLKLRWIDANDALNWAFVTLKLEVGDNAYDCSVQTGEDCSITQDGSDDGVWETNEFIQLHEAGTEICGLAGVSCTINIYIQYDGSTVVGTQTVALS
jgi:flagellin-like protein